MREGTEVIVMIRDAQGSIEFHLKDPGGRDLLSSLLGGRPMHELEPPKIRILLASAIVPGPTFETGLLALLARCRDAIRSEGVTIDGERILLV